METVQSTASRVYFVIVCYNNRDLIDTCLMSIKSQTYKNIKIIIVDNNSSDGSAAYIQQNYPDVVLIASKENSGFAIANNRGIEIALKDPSCAYVALLNTDATIDDNWTKTILNFAKTKPRFASAQTPTLDYFDHGILDSRGITIDPQGRAKQLGYREKYIKRESHLIFGVNAAACIFSTLFIKHVYDRHETLFDEDMWMYLEDVDAAARATMSGWKNYYIDGSFAYHMGSASSSKNPGFSVFYCYRNNYLMLLKSLPIGSLLEASFGCVATDLVTLAKLARHHNFIPLKAILKGRFAAIKMLPLFLQKRRHRDKQKISKINLKKLMRAS